MSTPLSNAYAAILREKGSEQGFIKKLRAFMAHRGHLSLLPEIVRVLERDPMRKGARVYLAKHEDGRKHSKDIRESLKLLGEEEAETIIDPDSVGGYKVLANSNVIDRSYRTALVSLYQKTVGIKHD